MAGRKPGGRGLTLARRTGGVYDARNWRNEGVRHVRTADIETRGNYRHFLEIPTRWMDNDIYGHVNNVVYYSYVDTVINRYLISAGGFDPHNDPTVGITPETRCWFKKSITYPQVVDAGLRVGRLGSSSVRYEVGL